MNGSTLASGRTGARLAAVIAVLATAAGCAGPAEAGYDFVVAEECAQYDECGAYADVYGGAVIDVEYEADGWAAVCGDPAQPVSTVLRDRELGTPGDEGYVLETC